MNIPAETIINIIKSFDDVEIHNAWGEISCFYNPNKQMKRGTYFMTIKEKDGENDKASNLDRVNIFRLNFGLPSSVFVEMFGAKPKRPSKGECIDGSWDFTELDKIMPHPVYGWMGWVCVLNPSELTFKTCLLLIQEAYKKAQKTAETRLKKDKK